MKTEVHVRSSRFRLGGWAALACCLALVAPGAATAKPPKYKHKTSVESISYLKSVCVSGEYTVTETILIRDLFKRSGNGVVSQRDELGKGEQRSSGSRTTKYNKVVQGPDPAPPEEWESTYQFGSNYADWSPFTKAPAGVRVDLGIPGAKFYSLEPLKNGKTKTFPIEKESPTKYSEEGNCTYEERSSMSGDLVVTRVR